MARSMPAVYLALLIAAILAVPAGAQQNVFIPGLDGGGNGNLFPGNNGPGQNNGLGQNNAQGGNQQGANAGFPGGAANADFETLMDLISSTVAPDSWVENGGVEADIRPFPGGVWVDAAGELRQFEAANAVKLTSLEVPAAPANSENQDARKSAALRCVSLPRLEAEIYKRMSEGRSLDESMLVLAGLRHIEYVFVYPDLGDVVLAGLAGDWRLDAENRLVAADSATPVVRLDDLLTLLRREQRQSQKPFGCSITPRQEQLAATQAFLDASSAEPLRPGRKARDKWLEELRGTLGRQDIEVFGLSGGTHAAHILVKADYHMKRIGIGLEEGAPGVESYLDTVARHQDQAPLSVLRWWFSTNYEGLAQNADATAYEFAGQGVCVLSENELLTKRGERIHTGKADDATQQFAHQFTNEFEALANKYPVYGELRNLFDLAMVAALLNSRDVYASIGWQPVLFQDAKHLPLPDYVTPREVDTILNHRVIDKTKILAAVSGGVWIDSQGVLAKSTEPSEKLDYHRQHEPVDVPVGEWWWDLE